MATTDYAIIISNNNHQSHYYYKYYNYYNYKYYNYYNYYYYKYYYNYYYYNYYNYYYNNYYYNNYFFFFFSILLCSLYYYSFSRKYSPPKKVLNHRFVSIATTIPYIISYQLQMIFNYCAIIIIQFVRRRRRSDSFDDVLIEVWRDRQNENDLTTTTAENITHIILALPTSNNKQQYNHKTILQLLLPLPIT